MCKCLELSMEILKSESGSVRSSECISFSFFFSFFPIIARYCFVEPVWMESKTIGSGFLVGSLTLLFSFL